MCANVYVDVHVCVCVEFVCAFTMTGGFAGFKAHLHNNVNIQTCNTGSTIVHSSDNYVQQPCKGCKTQLN